MAGPLVAVLDDNKDIGTLVRYSLEDAGFRCMNWQSVLEAQLDDVWDSDDPPVAVVVDKMMPTFTGVDFALWMKDTNPGVPLVMLTADENQAANDVLVNEGLFKAWVVKNQVLELGALLRELL